MIDGVKNIKPIMIGGTIGLVLLPMLIFYRASTDADQLSRLLFGYIAIMQFGIHLVVLYRRSLCRVDDQDPSWFSYGLYFSGIGLLGSFCLLFVMYGLFSQNLHSTELAWGMSFYSVTSLLVVGAILGATHLYQWLLDTVDNVRDALHLGKPQLAINIERSPEELKLWRSIRQNTILNDDVFEEICGDIYIQEPEKEPIFKQEPFQSQVHEMGREMGNNQKSSLPAIRKTSSPQNIGRNLSRR